MENVYIQSQNSFGLWMTYTITQNNSQLILSAMQQLKWQFPEYRVRAVDESGRLIDILY